MGNGIEKVNTLEAPVSQPAKNNPASFSLVAGGCVWAAVIFFIICTITLGLLLPILTWTAVPQPFFDILIAVAKVLQIAFWVSLFTVILAVPLGSLIAVISGHIAFHRSNGMGHPGRKKSISGLVLGYSGVTLLCLSLIGLAVIYNNIK